MDTHSEEKEFLLNFNLMENNLKGEIANRWYNMRDDGNKDVREESSVEPTENSAEKSNGYSDNKLAHNKTDEENDEKIESGDNNNKEQVDDTNEIVKEKTTSSIANNEKNKSLVDNESTSKLISSPGHLKEAALPCTDSDYLAASSNLIKSIDKDKQNDQTPVESDGVSECADYSDISNDDEQETMVIPSLRGDLLSIAHVLANEDAFLSEFRTKLCMDFHIKPKSPTKLF